MCLRPEHCRYQPRIRSNADEGARYSHAHRELHSLTWRGFGALMRRYCVSAAAKDCSIMLAIARDATSASSQSECDRQPHVGVSTCEACRGMLNAFAQWQVEAAAPTGTATQEAHTERLSNKAREETAQLGGHVGHTCTERLQFARSVFRVRLVVVDLDRKPLSKVLKHWDKDREILELAHGRGGVV